MAQTALLDAEFLHIHLRGGKLSYSSQKPKYIIPVGHEWAAAQLPNGKLYFGEQGWHERRNADLKILETFLSKKTSRSTLAKRQYIFTILFYLKENIKLSFDQLLCRGFDQLYHKA
jgi:hypothetical protein